MTFFLFCIFEYIPVPLISLFILIYRWFKANFRSSVIRWISRIWKFWIKYSICFLPILTNAYILDTFMGVSCTLGIKYYKPSIRSFDKSKLIKETLLISTNWQYPPDFFHETPINIVLWKTLRSWNERLQVED